VTTPAPTLHRLSAGGVKVADRIVKRPSLRWASVTMTLRAVEGPRLST
jgi:hypothetical protein